MPYSVRYSRRVVVSGCLAAGAIGLLSSACRGRSAPADDAAAPTPPQRRSPITVVYLGRGAGTEAYDREKGVMDSFNQSSPYVKVDAQPGPASWVELKQKFVVAHASGTPVDFVQNGWGSWLDLQEGDAITELSPYFTRDKVPSDYLMPRTVEQYSHQGRIWGLPIHVSSDAVAYNMDLFDRAGLPYPPANPADKSWTMERFLEYARKLTLGTDQFGLTGRHGYWYNEGHFFGHVGWDDRQQKASFTTPGYRAALQYFSDLLSRYHVVPTAEQATAIRGGVSGDLLLSGKVGMTFTIGPTILLPKEQVPFRWGLATLPYTPSPASPNNISGRMWPHALHVGKVKDPDAVWEVFRWLLKPENGGMMTSAVSPIVKGGSDWAQKRFTEITGVDGRAYVLQAQASYATGAGMLKYANYDAVNRDITPLWNDFRADKISVNDFTDQAQRIVEERLLPPVR